MNGLGALCRLWRWGLASAVLLAGCATPAVGPLLPPATRVLIYGEQHDQADQQRQVADAVRALAGRGRLRAVVMEMADDGRSTAGLERASDEATVRAALAWDDGGWPWRVYGPVVMAAVRAGVPVRGGNLPRSRLREAMGDAALDHVVPPAVRAQLVDAVRDGHCGLLPESQLGPMTRVQIARDRSLAATVRAAAPADIGRAGSVPTDDRVVVLLAGAQHASRDRGVPLHLSQLGVPPEAVRVVMFNSAAAEGLQADEHRSAERSPSADHCAALRARVAP